MVRVLKDTNVLLKIHKCIHRGEYIYTSHARIRMLDRNIYRDEVKHILLEGYHEKTKDNFVEINNSWNYSIRGKTEEGKDLRVIVSFDINFMLIITAIDLG